MGRINIEDARIRVEFRKNETNEVIKNEWFNVISFDNSAGFEYDMDELLEETGADYYEIVEFEDIQTFVKEMFDAQYPDCPLDIKYYIDYSLYQRDLMFDFWEIDGHIFNL